MDYWLPPPPYCPACQAFEVLPFAHILPDNTLAMRTPAGDYSIEDQLTSAASQALKSTTGVRWLAPAEPAHLLWGAAIRLASISEDGSVAGPALQVTPGGLDLVAPMPGSPASRERFGSALSATEGSLFVIGGVLTGGQPAGDIWRYRVFGGLWSVVDTDGRVVPGAVLAATYDAYGHRLVVLDEVGTAPDTEARLWSLDLQSGSMHVFGTWPRTGFYDQFALGHSHDGSFVLLASHGHGVPLKVLRLLITNGNVEIEGVRTTTGVPGTAPRTNQRGIHIVVKRPGKQIVGDRIDWVKLNPPGHKTLADFVK